MQVEVLPCFRLPRNKASFTYVVPEELKNKIAIGQFVEIPWRNKAEQGVVTAIHTKQVYKGPTKPILKLLEPTPSLTPDTIQAVFSIAQKYYTSPATLLALLVPDIPKKQHQSKQHEFFQYRFPDLKVHHSAVDQVKQITDNKDHQVVRLMSESDRLLLYRQLCGKHDQLIIVTANISDAEEITSYLIHHYPERIAFIDNRLAKNSQWNLWNEIKAGKKSIIIGTRSAALAPLSNPTLFVLDQQGRSDHKQWEGSPYLDTRDLVREIATAHSISLLETAFIPEVSDSPSIQTSSPELVPAHIMFRKGATQISNQLALKLEEATPDKKLAIVMPSLVQAGVFYCLDCENIWTCPSCGVSLRVFSNKLACSICDHEESIPTACTNCRGHKIKPIGIGLHGMKQLLETEYKLSVGIYTASEQDLSDKNQVVLLSPYQLKKLVQEVSGVHEFVLYHPEQLLYSPDFKSAFQFYHYIHWHRLMSQLYASGEFSLQTDLPTDHALLQQVISDQYQVFIENELKLRKQLKYPPYSNFVGISFEPGEKTPEFGPQFMGPFRRSNKKIQWLIKQSLDQNLNLDKILGSFYNKAKIDLNPDQISFIEFKENA